MATSAGRAARARSPSPGPSPPTRPGPRPAGRGPAAGRGGGLGQLVDLDPVGDVGGLGRGDEPVEAGRVDRAGLPGRHPDAHHQLARRRAGQRAGRRRRPGPERGRRSRRSRARRRCRSPPPSVTPRTVPRQANRSAARATSARWRSSGHEASSSTPTHSASHVDEVEGRQPRVDVGVAGVERRQHRRQHDVERAGEPLGDVVVVVQPGQQQAQRMGRGQVVDRRPRARDAAS